MSNSVKRVISSLVIVPIVLSVFVFGNKYIIDIFTSIIAIRCIYEVLNAFKKENYHPIDAIAYIAAISIAFLHVVPDEYLFLYIAFLD